MVNQGRFSVRIAQSTADVVAAQSLRQLAFFGDIKGLDRDAFDDICTHFLIKERSTDTLVGCFRILPLAGGHDIENSYSAQFYELSALKAFHGKMLEMGRFCLHPAWQDPDILRLAWGEITAYVDNNNIDFLFGCSSFEGAKIEEHLDSLALLRDRHLAPKRWVPRVKSPDVFRLAAGFGHKPDEKRAQLAMPPLLRSYLLMGGWVSDHAVIDQKMNTLHVFTGLEVKSIPPARKRLLRALAG